MFYLKQTIIRNHFKIPSKQKTFTICIEILPLYVYIECRRITMLIARRYCTPNLVLLLQHVICTATFLYSLQVLLSIRQHDTEGSTFVYCTIEYSVQRVAITIVCDVSYLRHRAYNLHSIQIAAQEERLEVQYFESVSVVPFNEKQHCPRIPCHKQNISFFE